MRDEVEFEAEDTGNYLNVAKGAKITVIRHGVQTNLSEVETKPITLGDKEIGETWEIAADIVTAYMKDKKISIEGFEQIASSINSVFIALMQERRRR